MKTKLTVVSAILIICSACQTGEAQGDKVALRFMNDYVVHRNNVFNRTDDSLWVIRYSNATSDFKQAYVALWDRAYKEDDGYMNSDPILDAQDYPDSGFVILNTMDENGYVKLMGKNWSDFVVIVRVKKDNNHWFVDGAGRLNIPPMYQLPQ